MYTPCGTTCILLHGNQHSWMPDGNDNDNGNDNDCIKHRSTDSFWFPPCKTMRRMM